MTKLNKKNLNYKRVAKAASRQRVGDAPRKAHVARRLAVSGRRTKKNQKKHAHREKMREQELEALLPAEVMAAAAADAGGSDDDGSDDDEQQAAAVKVPLPHQAKAAADAIVAAKGGRVKGRSRKLIKVAGLDPRRGVGRAAPGGKKKNGRAAAAAIAAALAARDAGGSGGKAGGGGGAAAAGGGDVMEE